MNKPKIGQEIYVKGNDEKSWEIATITSIGNYGFFHYRPSWATSITKVFNPNNMQYEGIN